MDPSELYQAWQAQSDRPAWVREHRDQLNEHTDTSEPVPDGSLAEVRDWIRRYKGTVTRQLDDAVPGTDPQNDESGETTTPTDAQEDT